MKLSIAVIARAVLVVAVASIVAEAVSYGSYKGKGEVIENGNGRYKSIKECGEFVSGPGSCSHCCHQFGLIPTAGRLFILTPGLRQCKCITQEEDEKRRANRG